MEFLGIVGIALAIVAIIYLSVKGLNIVVAAPLATMIVIVTNRMEFFAFLIGEQPSYMTALAAFFVNNFAIFLLGAILAQYMDCSQATVVIANWVLEKVGLDHKFRVLVAFTAIAALLTYGGISVFVVMFALVSLAWPIFQQLDINWALMPIPLFLGMSTFTMTMLPGSPSVQNAVATTYIGTQLTAAPLLGVIAAIAVIIYGLAYMYWQLQRSLAKGETFYSYLGEAAPEAVSEAEEITTDLPTFSQSVAPLVILLALIFAFRQVAHILLLALSAAIVLAAILYRPYLRDQKSLMNQGAQGAVPSAFATSSSVAFGSVLTAAPAFSLIQQAIMNLPGSPLIGLAVATATLSGITGSSTGAVGIVMANFAQTYLDMGLSADLIHRVTAISSAILTVVPHSGVTITFNSISGLNFKNAFWHQFMIVNVAHLWTIIVVLIAAAILY